MATVTKKTTINLSTSDVVATSEPIPIRKPSMVYHYASIDTLKKILENGTLRLTNLTDTIDASEYNYGLKLLTDKISEFEYRQRIDFARRIPASFFNQFFPPMELYFISFTLYGDDFSFWNSGYVDKRSPIAIGFDTSLLESGGLILNRCIYHNPFENRIEDIYYKLSRLSRNYDLIRGDNEFWKLTFSPALIKSEHYSKENEWRCVSPLLDSGNKTTFIRFGEERSGFFCPIDLTSLSNIVIGPCLNQESNHALVSTIIQQYGLSAKVVNSQVDIRFDPPTPES